MMPSAALCSPAPRPIVTAIASTSGGKASTASITRIKTASTQPPVAPATMPIAPPKIAPMITTTAPTVSEMAAPELNRASMSRPTPSVPIGCARDGASSDAPTSILSGSFGQTNLPNSARKTSTAIASTASPRTGSWARNASARPVRCLARTKMSEPRRRPMSAETSSAIGQFSSNACG
jgi:hypothetical protein